MTKKLIQKTTFKTIEFTIDDTGLLFHRKSKNSEAELHFSFEQIKTNKVTEVDHNKLLVVTASIAALVAIIAFGARFSDETILPSTIFIWACISTALFIFYFQSRNRKIYLYTSDNNVIAFFANKKDIIDTNEFIEQLFHDRNLYLVSKYGNPNRNLDYTFQLNNLNWLLDTKALSKSSYDEKFRELNALFNNNLSKNPIGFSPKS